METYQSWANEILESVRKKMAWVSEKNRDKIPYTTDETGSYDNLSAGNNCEDQYAGLNWWTNGFWGGIMWLLYQDTKEEKYAQIARVSEKKLEKCFDAFYGLHHDVGFMFLPTSVANYRLTGNEEAKRNAMHAANLLAGRFNPVGRFIRAWNTNGDNDVRGWAIIDSMLNLSLLYWASRESGDPRFRHIAVMHADTTLASFIRDDGSVCHIVEFDPETGERLKSYGGQGYAHGSSWTRGHGWALYGFANSYAHTKKQAYLDAAKQVAHYCIANLREDGIVPVDFRQPAEPAWEDSCGACIIADGLLEIARFVPENEKEMYTRAAVKILRAIVETRADWTENCDAIVQNCTAAYYDGKPHFPMVYADYFLIEALYKLTGTENLIW